jgi:TolB-like protein
MEVLLCLARHPGETRSKEQLFQAVWPNVIVTEDVLKRCIAELRRAFDDDARDPHIIETIPKRGYRLLAPVSALPAATAPSESAVTASIVVLPFTNLSADPENEYFADGITEEIIDALVQIQGLHVVARSSAFSFKGKYIDLRVVGEQLNVRTILEGSVRRADNRVRITAQLVSTSDGYHLWSERYDREMKDVFAIQEEIAQAITQRLRGTVRVEWTPPVADRLTRSEASKSPSVSRSPQKNFGPDLHERSSGEPASSLTESGRTSQYSSELGAPVVAKYLPTWDSLSSGPSALT